MIRSPFILSHPSRPDMRQEFHPCGPTVRIKSWSGGWCHEERAETVAVARETWLRLVRQGWERF